MIHVFTKVDGAKASAFNHLCPAFALNPVAKSLKS